MSSNDDESRGLDRNAAGRNSVDNELERLLSGGGLSVLEEESILDVVLEKTASGPAPEAAAAPVAAAPSAGPGLFERFKAWFLLPPALAAAAAAALFLVGTEQDDGFTSRGTADPVASAPVTARCAGPCRPGSEVVIAWRAGEPAWASAAAVGPDDTLLWLFVGEPAAAGQALAWKAKLPADAAPGTWQLLLTSVPEGQARPTKDSARTALSAHLDGAPLPRGARVVAGSFLVEGPTASAPAGPEGTGEPSP